MPTLDQLRENYSRFTDAKILTLASKEASTLTSDGLQALKDEIRKRGMSEDLLIGIKVQSEPLDSSKFNEYCDIIQNEICPICNSKDDKLNATLVGEVVSMIIMTRYEKNLKIGCPSCLVKENNSGLAKSLLLGWWGVPWGVINTIQSVFFNNKMSKQAQQKEPNAVLKSFIISNIGSIEIAKNNPEKMRNLLLNFKI